jgi:hypothetical protein
MPSHQWREVEEYLFPQVSPQPKNAPGVIPGQPDIRTSYLSNGPLAFQKRASSKLPSSEDLPKGSITPSDINLVAFRKIVEGGRWATSFPPRSSDKYYPSPPRAFHTEQSLRKTPWPVEFFMVETMEKKDRTCK